MEQRHCVIYGLPFLLLPSIIHVITLLFYNVTRWPLHVSCCQIRDTGPGQRSGVVTGHISNTLRCESIKSVVILEIKRIENVHLTHKCFVFQHATLVSTSVKYAYRSACSIELCYNIIHCTCSVCCFFRIYKLTIIYAYRIVRFTCFYYYNYYYYYT